MKILYDLKRLRAEAERVNYGEWVENAWEIIRALDDLIAVARAAEREHRDACGCTDHCDIGIALARLAAKGAK